MENLNNHVYMQENGPLLQSLIEGKELEKWQKHFCDISNVFACCVDSRGVPLTEFSGKPEEIHQIKNLIDQEQFQNMLFRVSESTLEDQAIETTAWPNLRLAVISAKAEGRPVINWLICGVLSEVSDPEDYSNPLLEGFTTVVSEKQFNKAIDILRDLTEELLLSKLNLISAQAESRRSRYSELEMGNSLRRSEVITEIVQLLESDDAIEVIMLRILEIVGTFLNAGSATICRTASDQEHMSIVAKWYNVGIVSAYDQSSQQVSPFYIKTKKPLVLSSNTIMSVVEREEMRSLKLTAVMVIPVAIGPVADMFVCIGEKLKERVWQVEEIKFLNDAVKILKSIIQRRIQKNSLAGSYASLENILNNVGSSIYVKDAKTGSVLFANRNMHQNFEKELDTGSLNEILGKGITSESGINEIYHEEKDCWYDLYYTKIKWVDGRLVLLCALFEITEKKLYQKKIEQQAYTDFLTGLYNRLCCERDLAKFVDEAKKDSKQGALLYLDLDDFKHINDGLGHQYGDMLLKSISNSLQRIEGIETTCYRMGGDEFVIIIPPFVYKRFESIVASIRDIFMKPWYLKDADYYCTMSMGVVKFPREGDAVHELIKKADIAMYEAKKHGKNRIAEYSHNMDLKSGKRLDMEKNMRDATTSGYKEFEVYLQPIIDNQKEGLPCTGAEALIRWNSLELGFIPPAEFIPLAEYLGLINPIGNYVLKEACINCKYWNDFGYPDYKVNVNLSVVQLLQADIIDIVQKTVEDTGIKPCNLTLEVTESLAINDVDRMKEILESIKKLGVRIALDDFGTGYSSLNHIREIPFDVIKVDQSFIKDLKKESYSRSFVKMVADLAEAIGVNLCVEGVETKEQYEILSEMNISLLQGYYFDRPMPREDFEEKYLPLLNQNPKKKK